MNFKKKAIIGIAAGLFAVATVFNMNMLNDNGAGDVSLDTIEIMAQAETENSARCSPKTFDCSGGGPGSNSCSVKTDTIAGGVTYSVTCDSPCYACCNGFHGAKCVEETNN